MVTATGDPVLDPQRIRDAIADPREFDEIVLQGTFNFGDGSASAPRQTVIVPRGITFVGDSALVKGGGAVTGSFFGNTEGGPFKVENAGAAAGGDDKPVAFQRIAFSGWAGEAISAQSCQGLEVTGCEFTKPVPGNTTGLGLPGLDTYISAIWAAGPGCRGTLLVEQNIADLTDYTPLANDEQLVGCQLTNFERISMVGNKITGHDDGLEIVMNGYYSEDGNFGPIQIARNEITLDLALPNPYVGSGGISCLRNRNSSTLVEQNTVNLTGNRGLAITLSGENMTVSNNSMSLGAAGSLIPFGGIALGLADPAPGFPENLGPSLNKSTIANNTVTGTAYFGIVFVDLRYHDPTLGDTPNESHGNRVINNDLSALNALAFSLFAGPDTYDNVFNGCFASVLDMSTANKLHNTCAA